MWFVYILQSMQREERFYVGVASDVDRRLQEHNASACSSTKKNGPWRVKTFIGFDDRRRAFAFEKYLKSGSGRAFAKRRL